MPRNRATNPSNEEIIRLAIEGVDAQIAALQEKRAQLAERLGGSSKSAAGASAGAKKRGRKKRRKMSEETKQKLRAAATARWQRIRTGKAKKPKKRAAKKAA